MLLEDVAFSNKSEWLLIQYENDKMSSVNGDTVNYISNADILIKAKDEFSVNISSKKYRDCEYKTPAFNMILYKNGTTYKSVSFCYSVQVHYGIINENFIPALRKVESFEDQQAYQNALLKLENNDNVFVYYRCEGSSFLIKYIIKL